MNKYSIISIIAIIVIIIPVFYGVWSIFSIDQIKIGTPNEEFSYFEMSSYETIKICNPMPFFVSFNGLTISTFYTQNLIGVFELGPTTLNPGSSEIVEINFTSENFAESQYLFMHMDGQFDGELPIRLDPSKMVVVTNIETQIIGVIPYTSTNMQSGFDFTNMMNENSSCESN